MNTTGTIELVYKIHLSATKGGPTLVALDFKPDSNLGRELDFDELEWPLSRELLQQRRLNDDFRLSYVDVRDNIMKALDTNEKKF